MNKQELIEKVTRLPYENYKYSPYVERKSVLRLVSQLDEPQKVQVPKFVADWYEEHKDNLEYNIWDWMKYNLEPKKRENVIFSRWLGKTVNNPVETLIKMKLYGYEVKKEKLYRVRIKGVCFNSCLIFERINKTWLFSSIYETDHQRGNHTRKELEEAGFGEVFNSPLFEVEEV